MPQTDGTIEGGRNGGTVTGAVRPDPRSILQKATKIMKVAKTGSASFPSLPSVQRFCVFELQVPILLGWSRKRFDARSPPGESLRRVGRAMVSRMLSAFGNGGPAAARRESNGQSFMTCAAGLKQMIPGFGSWLRDLPPALFELWRGKRVSGGERHEFHRLARSERRKGDRRRERAKVSRSFLHPLSLSLSTSDIPVCMTRGTSRR
jgi:hypothetical protein